MICNDSTWGTSTLGYKWPEEHKAHRTLLKEDAAVAAVTFASSPGFGTGLRRCLKYPPILRTQIKEDWINSKNHWTQAWALFGARMQQSYNHKQHWFIMFGIDSISRFATGCFSSRFTHVFGVKSISGVISSSWESRCNPGASGRIPPSRTNVLQRLFPLQPLSGDGDRQTHLRIYWHEYWKTTHGCVWK